MTACICTIVALVGCCAKPAEGRAVTASNRADGKKRHVPSMLTPDVIVPRMPIKG